MRLLITLVLQTCVIVSVSRAAEPSAGYDHNWPQWRGPWATGVAPHGDPPVEWSEEKNIRWKVRIPGEGFSTPIVWDDRVFVMTAIKTDQMVGDLPPIDKGHHSTTNIFRFSILALDRRDGSVIWQRDARAERPHEQNQLQNSWCSFSPVTDGEHVYAFFGSRGIFCYTLDGTLVWEKDLGNMTVAKGNGEGSSPVLYRDMIIVNWDHEGESFIVALDKATGAERWKVSRDEPTSWSTPVIAKYGDRAQIVVAATNRVRGYEPDTGELIWECAGMTVFTMPSPVAHRGLVYATSGHRGAALLAIRVAGAKGDITGSAAIAWQVDRDTPDVSSPVLYDDTLYFLKGNKGILTRLDAGTGQRSYINRLAGIRDIFASPVAANGRLYCFDRDGNAVVVRHSPEFELLAQNSLDDSFTASPAIAGNELYVRGRSHLYCIARD